MRRVSDNSCGRICQLFTTVQHHGAKAYRLPFCDWHRRLDNCFRLTSFLPSKIEVHFYTLVSHQRVAQQARSSLLPVGSQVLYFGWKFSYDRRGGDPN
ncbi:hypothetical protein HJC23_002280 [Cyclotella cryptica]|uniref:Uncharacterized protein n=1 Tax=Cyclotella cryptica TaxID=29204 RepID=A0ABD3QFS1_9STRA